MNAQAVTLQLPSSLYDLLRQRARDTRRSLEAEILDVVTTAVRPADASPPPRGRLTRREDVPSSPLIIEDPEVLEGNWTWGTDENGQLMFQSRQE